MLTQLHIILFTISLALTLNAQQEGFGEAPISGNITSCLSENEREEIKALIQSRRTPSTQSRTSTVKFIWPIKQSSNYNESEVIGISNYVDLNDSYPNNLLDYNCGARTYDTESGYNHKGTDIYSWPFTWHKMDHDHIQIIAAASGKIIHKQDFNYDKSCSFNSNQWNAVYVEHSDGSVAWYGHLKENSLTEKAIGDQVEVGDYIGIMGSSGNSTGPHLHLEIYDANNNLIDPYVGECNSTTTESWWAVQQEYTVPGINMLATHKSPPVFGCSVTENPNFEINFNHSETVYFVTYYRDQLEAISSSHKVYKPDGSLFTEWTTTPSQYYSGSYWYRSFSLPSSGDIGKWTFEVGYQGQTATEYFYLTNDNSEIELSTESILYEDYAIGDRIVKSFEIKNVGTTGIRVDEINYPTGFSGNWDGLIHASEAKTIEFTFSVNNLDELDDELTIRYNGNQSIKLALRSDEIPLRTLDDAKFNFYPNPVVNGEINIISSENSSFELLNMNGQIILNTKDSKLDVSSLQSGIYFLRVNDGEKIGIEKILVRN